MAKEIWTTEQMEKALSKRKPKPKRPDIIRPWDEVRVVVPKVFVRCGYPMDYNEEVAKVAREMRGDILKLYDKALPKPPEPEIKLRPYQEEILRGMTASNSFEGQTKLVEKVAKILAFERMNAAGFGGNRRSIYERDEPELAGQEFTVRSVRWVKTGTYYPGHACGGYEWDDYEPAGLEEEATVKILGLNGFKNTEMLASRVVKVYQEGFAPAPLEIKDEELLFSCQEKQEN